MCTGQVRSLKSSNFYAEISLEPVRSTNDWSEAKFGDQDRDFGEVKGQQHVKRKVEVAAADGHNILMV
jgi:magnesium chelatase family protein